MTNPWNVLKWAFALYVHGVFLLSLIDVWPKEIISDTVTPSKPYKWANSPSDRVVLFYVEGISSEWMFNFSEHGEDLFLANVSRLNGSAGVVITEEPESTFTALAAMLVGTFTHESLFSDWAISQPKEIDSLLDRVANVHYFGDDKVLAKLRNYASTTTHWDKFITPRYTGESVPGLTNKCSFHNDWITNKAVEFYSHDTSQVNSNKTMIIIHLTAIGCHERNSQHLSVNRNCVLRSISDSVEKMTQSIKGHYTDNKTSFLFTSGYGNNELENHWLPSTMASNHFSVHLRTPLIAWGSGVSTSLRTPENMIIIKLPIAQTSIAPLIGTLLGVGVPSKCIGLLPCDYLNLSEKEVAEALQNNTKHLQNILLHKVEEIANSSWCFYDFFNPLLDTFYIDLSTKLNLSIASTNYSGIRAYSIQLSMIIQREIEFTMKYYRDIASFFICICLVFWVLLLLSFTVAAIPDSESSEARAANNNQQSLISPAINLSLSEYTFHFVMFILLLMFSTYPILEGLPIRFSCYTSLSIMLIWFILTRALHFSRTCQDSQPRIMFYTLMIIWISCTFDISPINYFSLMIFFTFMSNADYTDVPPSELQLWLLTSLAAMPLIVYEDSSPQLVTLFTSVVWLTVVFVFFEKKSSLCVLIGAILLTIVCIRVSITDWGVINNCNAPFSLLIIGWLCFVPIFCIPILGTDSFLTRTLEVAVLIAAPYLMMNTQLEAAAMMLVQLNLLAWVYVENHSKFTMKEMVRLSIKEHAKRPELYDDMYLPIIFRRAFCFIVYIFYMHLASGTPVLSSFLLYQTDNLFPCMRSIPTVAVSEILKHFFQVLVICTYLAVTCRISRIPLSKHVPSIMYFCNLFCAGFFIPFLCLDGESIYNKAIISRLWIGVLLPIIVLLVIPIAYYLTGPSMFSVKVGLKSCCQSRNSRNAATNERQ